MAFEYKPHDWVPNEIITEEKLDHIESGLTDLNDKLQPVAETGSYNDLSDKPQINGHELSGDVTIDSLGFHKVATSGSYEDLDSKPTINGHELTGAQDTDSLDLRYTLPNASEEELGGIKIGERLSIDESGKLSVESRLSQYTNDNEFQTKTEVAAAIQDAQHLKKKKVDVLPPAEEMEEDVIYLVPTEKGEENNAYDEYLKIDGKAEFLGTTKTDLTDYAKLTDLDELVTGGSIEGFVIKLDKKDNSQVEIQLPQNLSEFTNDENFTTKVQVQAMIDESGGGGGGGGEGGNFKIEVVDEIPRPSQMSPSTIYMVPRTEAEANDQYDEYVLVNDTSVEKIGGSLTKEQLESLIAKASRYDVNIQSPSWTPDGELFKTVVEVSEMNLDDNSYGFIADIVQTNDAEQDEVMRENWLSVVRMTIENNQLTIYSETEFDALNLQLLVFAIGELSGGGGSFNIAIINALPEPTAAKENTIYLVAKENGSSEKDNYDEYIFVKQNNSFERFGGIGSGINNEVQAALDTKAEKPIELSATIPTEGWNGEDTKIVTVAVEEIKSTDNPIIDVDFSDAKDEKIQLLNNWGLILDITTTDGNIVIEAVDTPDIAIPIKLQVVR